MKFYLEDFTEGMQEMFSLHKQGNNIFDIKGGSLFPHNTSQKTWEYANDDNHIHLSDGTNTYSFKGQLADYDSELEKLPEAPLPEIFSNAKAKHKAQVHRSDPGSIYFTLQEGRNNPTYTLKHVGDNKWKAIPKPRKVKDMLKQPVVPHNVNLEHVKEGMLHELATFAKTAEGTNTPLLDLSQVSEGVKSQPSALQGLNLGAGKLVQEGANLIPNLALSFGRTGPVGNAGYGNPDPNASESLTSGLSNAAIAGGVGAGLGGAYHLAKRHLLNTDEENRQEDQDGGHALKRILGTGGAFAGMNMLDRNIFPKAINNPELQAFPAS